MFSAIIEHKALDNIYVYWHNGLLKEIGVTPSHYELVASPGALQEDMPAVYTYLKNLGQIKTPPFGFDLLDLSHCGTFAKKVYETLFAQPFGELITYKSLAQKAGYQGACRAVGTVMRKNKLMLVVPCHRVVGSDNLGGFSAGMDTKLRLLNIEGIDYSHLIQWGTNSRKKKYNGKEK